MRVIAIIGGLFVIVIVGETSGTFFAQTKGGQKNTGSVSKEGEPVEVRFVNGSRVIMTLSNAPIEITTKYGKLTVPANDIRHVEFGYHAAPGVKEKIAASLAKLDNAKFRPRQQGLKELIMLGPQVYPVLLEQKEKGSEDRQKLILSAIKAIEKEHPKTKLRRKTEDVVHTHRFKVVGRISNKKFKAKAQFIGELEMMPAHLQSITLRRAIANKKVSVHASQFGLAGKWLDTGFRVEPNTKLTIRASGQVDLNPGNPGQLVVGPKGSEQEFIGGGGVPGGLGGFAAGGGLGGIGGIAGGFAGGVNGAPKGTGMLTGRIGKLGRVVKVGDSYTAYPTEAGKLYLHIVPSPFRNASGSYTVFISARPNFNRGDDE